MSKTANTDIFIIESSNPHVVQTKFELNGVDENLRNSLFSFLTGIYDNIKAGFKNSDKFNKVLIYGHNYSSSDLVDNQLPEEFARQYIISPLLDFLGYKIISETSIRAPTGIKQPDYLIRPLSDQNFSFYVEAEPINIDLRSKGHGVNQVRDWLLSRVAQSDYGIATDGLTWEIVKFNNAEADITSISRIQLRPIFSKIHNPSTFLEQNELDQIYDSFLALHNKYVVSLSKSYVMLVEEEKERITNSFYREYVAQVFGFDADGKPTNNLSLINSVRTPNGQEKDRGLFSVILMNRLIFIKFLEEKSIVKTDLLIKILRAYRESESPSTFYNTFLKPLFYEVFNKSLANRSSSVRVSDLYSNIPYLNGGLFRESIRNETLFDVDNNGLEKVIEGILNRYSFGSGEDHQINPEILGYIFEKTINFISGTGTNQKKLEGAFYTPEWVVSFMVEKTILPEILERTILALKNEGWTDRDLSAYRSIYDILDPEKITKNPHFIRKIIDALSEMKIIDPACGSGHFLTSVLSEILRIKVFLYRIIGEEPNRFKLKKEIITRNIYGVDLDRNAVEIARLRLWLSIISEVENIQNIDTLPNIDFNIISGNAVIGWLDEERLPYPLVTLSQDDYISGILDGLSTSYPVEIPKIRNALSGTNMTDAITAYNMMRALYGSEQGTRALQMREILEKIKGKLYPTIDKAYAEKIERDPGYEMRNRVALSMLGEARAFHWHLEFYDVLSNGGFDIVIGNPPYNAKFTENEKKYVSHKYPATKNNLNSAIAFINRSKHLLRKGGYLGFVVPKPLLFSQKWKNVRDFVKEEMIDVADFSKAFKDVLYEEICLVLKLGSKFDVYNTYLDNRNQTVEVDKKLINLFKSIICSVSIEEIKIGTKLLKGKDLLSKVADVERGVFIPKYLKKKGDIPILRGKNIGKYGIKDFTEFISKDDFKALEGEVKYLLKPKIVMQNIIAHVKNPTDHILFMAAMDENSLITLDNVANFFYDPKLVDPNFLLGLLNSKLMEWFAYRFVYSKAIRTMRFDKHHMTKLPLCNYENKKEYDDVIRIVKEIREVVEKNPSDKPNKKHGSSQKLFEEKVSLVNNLIYNLYDLSDDEITLIESTNNVASTSGFLTLDDISIKEQ